MIGHRTKKPKGISNDGLPTEISLFEFSVLCHDHCWEIAMQQFCHYDMEDYLDYWDAVIPSWFEEEDKVCDQSVAFEVPV